ncbi:MAG: phosphoglycerate kinase [Candidatus Thermoplasmatota archaeon]|nr:phosphoglycerate kinase [Candidatus Thermoplasmatota archaeon]MEC9146332.1 phosphoglycerate kinase [Candidatus Thermoplasmatota archaeon]
MAIGESALGPLVTGVLSLDDVSLDGKVVLLRVDVNSPMNPENMEFLDDRRFTEFLPTLDDLSSSKVVIISHQSRPGKLDFTSTEPHSKLLSRLTGRKVDFVPDVCGESAIKAIKSMENGDVLFLNNVRMLDEENSMKKASQQELAKSEIVRKLSSVADAYVTDAFATAHRSSPSLTGFTNEIPCIAGRLMKREINALRTAVYDPPRPYVAILGGIKCDDSLRVARNLIQNGAIDRIAMVGVVGNLMLWASGHDIGEGNREFIRKSLGEAFDETWQDSQKLVSEYQSLLFLPSDLAIEDGGTRKNIGLDDLPTNFPIYDIGIDTMMRLRPLLMEANCLLWNGPASYFEKSEFAYGTVEIMNMFTEATGVTIVGGGHTSALFNQRGKADQVSHNSTGGGSVLTMLSGGIMPVFESLEASDNKFRPLLRSLGISKE